MRPGWRSCREHIKRAPFLHCPRSLEIKVFASSQPLRPPLSPESTGAAGHSEKPGWALPPLGLRWLSQTPVARSNALPFLNNGLSRTGLSRQKSLLSRCSKTRNSQRTAAATPGKTCRGNKHTREPKNTSCQIFIQKEKLFYSLLLLLLLLLAAFGKHCGPLRLEKKQTGFGINSLSGFEADSES